MPAAAWRECALGDIITLKRGYDLPTRKRIPGPYPIVSSSGISGSHQEAKVKGPGVVTGRYGTLGEVFYIENDFWPLNTSLYVRDFKGNDPRYVAYLLQTLHFGGRSAAAAVPGINRNDLHRLAVRVPPLPTQRRIASILSAYDDLIDNNTRRIEILEEMAWRLYEEWFVHFRFPDHEYVKMVESEIGEVPERWEVKDLEQVCARITDGAHRSPPSVADGKRMASVKDMHNWGLDLSRCRHISRADFDELVRSDCKPQVGDILIAKDGANLNKHTFLVTEPLDVVLLSSIAILRPNASTDPEFLTAQLKEPAVSARIKRSVSGAAIPRIVLRDFKRLRIVVPPVEAQQKWRKMAAPWVDLCRLLMKKNTNLRAQRDLLLPKLISSEIDVSEISKPAVEVAAE